MDFPTHLIHIEHQSKQPLYDQIEQNLCELIIKGQLAPGQSLPSENELAELYGVNRLTVRRALDELVRHRWVERRRGIGTFVSQPRAVPIATSRLSFTEEMRAIGLQPGNRLISRKVIPAEGKLVTHLHLAAGAPLVEITRVRLADGIPLLLETAYLSLQRFPGLDQDPAITNGSLYALLVERYNVVVAGMDQTLRPVLLTRVQAQFLGVKPGAPAIASEIVAYTQDGDPVEYSWSVASGDQCEFYFRFRQGQFT